MLTIEETGVQWKEDTLPSGVAEEEGKLQIRATKTSTDHNLPIHRPIRNIPKTN